VNERDRIRQKRTLCQAEGYLELGMPHAALEVLERLRSNEFLGAHGMYLVGEALRSLERYHEALVPLSAAAGMAPEDVHIPLAMAWCFKRVGKLVQAVRTMEHALDYSPNHGLLHYNLACYLSLTGRRQRSLHHLSKALTLDPDYRLLIDDEPDFDPIRTDPGFVALTSIVV